MFIFSTTLLSFLGLVGSLRILAVMDFDYTLVDANSVSIITELVPENLRPISSAELYKREKSFLPFVNLFYRMAHRLHVKPEKIVELIGNVPAIEGMDKLLDHLYCNECDVIIISNSYSIFVSEWLQSKSLFKSVKQIFSNPSWFNKMGMLVVDRYQNQTACKISPSNLCKRLVLSNFLQTQRFRSIVYDNIVYIGDGKNDLCAVQLLTSKDLVFPRIGFELFQMLSREPYVNAQIHPWSSGTDIIEVIKTKLHLNVNSNCQHSNETSWGVFK